MGMFEDGLDDGMRETQRVMREHNVPYAEAYKIVTTRYQFAVADCGGTKWLPCDYAFWLTLPEDQRRAL